MAAICKHSASITASTPNKSVLVIHQLAVCGAVRQLLAHIHIICFGSPSRVPAIIVARWITVGVAAVIYTKLTITCPWVVVLIKINFVAWRAATSTVSGLHTEGKKNDLREAFHL
jgi:hypothetical protein